MGLHLPSGALEQFDILLPCARQLYSILFFFLMIRRPPSSTLFPYPPLFRSRDVDVGSPIPVEVGDGHAESITDLSQDAGLLGYVRERSVAVVPIKLIVTAGARALKARGVEIGRAHV